MNKEFNMDNRIIIGLVAGSTALVGTAVVVTPLIINKMKTKKGSGTTDIEDPSTVVPTTPGGDTPGGDDEPVTPGDPVLEYVDVKASNSITEATKHIYGVIITNGRDTEQTVTVKKSFFTSKKLPIQIKIPASKSYSLVSDTEPFRVVHELQDVNVKNNTVKVII